MKSGRIRAVGITSVFFMAKGLTFDSVLLPRLTAKAYDWTRREQSKRMMFVGIARATQWVYLSTVKGTEFGEMAVLREAAEKGHLAMQDGAWHGKPDRVRSDGRLKGRDDDYSLL